MGALPLRDVALARAYLVVQAVTGAAWWAMVFASPSVRRWTLGDVPPGWLVVPDLIGFAVVAAVAGIGGDRRWALATAAWTWCAFVGIGVYGLAERAAGWGVVLMAVATAGTTAAAATMWFGHLPSELALFGPFRFRPAPDRAGRSHLAHSLRQLVVFWTTFLVGLPLALAWVERRLRLRSAAFDTAGWDAAGLATFVVGSTLGLWSCATMALRGEGTPLPSATARTLVVAGPYRLVRNPMAVAGALQTMGVGLIAGSWAVLVVAGGVFWHIVIRPEEERDLLSRFGEPYRRYQRAVRCWVPGRPPAATG